MLVPKDSCSPKEEKLYKPTTFKQTKNNKNDTQAFNERIKVWLDKSKIDNGKRVSIITDITKLHTMRNLDITTVGPITALFITHKEEQIPWKIVATLSDMHFKDKISQIRLYPMLAWKFEKKYPLTQRSYASKLTISDLDNLREAHKSKDFKKLIAEYHPPLQRMLPENMEHRKSLERIKAPTLQPYPAGHSPSPLPLRLRTPSSLSSNTYTYTTPSFSQTPTSTTPSPAPTPKIKRSHSPPPNPPNKKPHPLSAEEKYMHQRLNNEYTAQFSELLAKKANKLATVHRGRAKLDEEEAEIEVWFEGELERLKGKEARLRASI